MVTIYSLIAVQPADVPVIWLRKIATRQMFFIRFFMVGSALPSLSLE